MAAILPDILTLRLSGDNCIKDLPVPGLELPLIC